MKYPVLVFSRPSNRRLCLLPPVQGGATVAGQVPLQLGQRGEIQAALHAHVLLAFLVLQLVGAELAGVSEPSAAHAAAAGADEASERERERERDEAKKKQMETKDG